MTGNQAAPLRVVQFCNTLDVADGGPARHALEVNRSLNASQDVDSLLMWFSESGTASLLEHDSDGVRAARVSPSAVVKELRNSDIAVIHGFYLWWVPLITVTCTVLGVPYALMPHGVFTRYQRQFSKPKKAIFDLAAGAAIIRRTRRILVATTQEREDLLSWRKADVDVVGAGTRLHGLPATASAHNPVRLVSVSRIAPKKRIDVTIEALKVLRAEGLDVVLTIAGSGDSALVEALQAQVSALALDPYVSFVGEVGGEEKATLLRASDFFVLSSEDENFGIAVGEALAHGVPVVATRHVNAASAAQGAAVRVVDAVDAHEIAQTIRSLLAAGNFQEIRGEAVKAAAEHFSWDVVSERWTHSLRSALAENVGRNR